MWYKSLSNGKSWTSLWGDYVLCKCSGIRKLDSLCPACGGVIPDPRPILVQDNIGDSHEVGMTFCGAEGRYEDYEFLALLEREWMRPTAASVQSHFTSGMSERAAVVLLFWTYFETKMNRLVALGMRDLPERIRGDLLSRHDAVSAKMRSFYQVLYGVTYLDDLIAVGAENIGGHLGRIQDCRNRFVHGDPKAISDGLVESVVRLLKDEHEAWIAVFNRRIKIARERAE